MSRQKDYPPGGFIVLPDEWLGEHAERRDQALIKSEDLPQTFRDFAVAVALCEDWGQIDALDGNPENWDFQKIPWALMSWIIETVLGDLNKALTVSKKS